MDCSEEKAGTISQLLGVENNCDYTSWSFEITENESDCSVDFVQTFLNYINGKEGELLELGVRSENISIWMLYEYDGQCNLEFSPRDMKSLGEKGISLCVSCWESLGT